MSRVFLVRHAKARLGDGRYWGHSQVGLDHEGVAQAVTLRKCLAGERIDAIYASDLKRASLTAQIIASVHPTQVVVCSELRELDFGKIEGMTFEQVEKYYPQAASIWNSGRSVTVAPEGEDLEQIASRVRRFATRLREHSPEHTILVVSHGGPLRLLLCCWLGIDFQRCWQIRLDPASVSLVETYPEGAIVCFLNSTSHLMPLRGMQQWTEDSSS